MFAMSTGQPARVCVIGAGISGMSILYHIDEFSKTQTVPDVVCFEKQSTWGGQWNFSWMTGTDEYGEPIHSGLYRHMWTNLPKECMEVPDYTFDDHFGKAIPSYISWTNVRSYLEGRWTTNRKSSLSGSIEFNTVVLNVQYDSTTDKFKVRVRNLKEDVSRTEIFTHVVVVNGIYSTPNKPVFPGMNEFPGGIVHSHDFRDAKAFKGQRVLIIGSSWSAIDIAMQCIKYGAKDVTCSWRSKPIVFKLPSQLTQRPLVNLVDGNTVHCVNGSSKDVDSIILCTGYLAKFPFMNDGLMLRTSGSLYPDNLYKGMQFMNGGNSKLFYIGIQNNSRLPLVDLQALWICRNIMETLPLGPAKPIEMREDIHKWLKKLETVKDIQTAVDFQASYIEDLASILDYNKDVSKIAAYYPTFLTHMKSDLATYRDNSFTSVYTGTNAIPSAPWLTQRDDGTLNSSRIDARVKSPNV